MQGKLIIVEGGDGSGKATQAALLQKHLLLSGRRVRKVEFPNYQSASSALIKMYLNGEFGSDPSAVNPYAASTFYAVDRYASFKKDWEAFYQDEGIIVADRYTTSNMVHQAVKIMETKAREAYLTWLWDLEFGKFGLPVPDCVLFLDMPPVYSQQLLHDRPVKSGEVTADIHEQDGQYLADCYHNAKAIANRYDWKIVPCVDETGLRKVDAIHADIVAITRHILA
jgi:dTMP kinase